MTGASKKYVIPIAAMAAAVCLAGIATYLLGIPPFQRHGEIIAKPVRQSLGTSNKVVPALKQTLPMDSEYSFADESMGRGVADGGYYSASCFVRGETSALLSTRIEMMRDEPSGNWARSEVSGNRNDGGRYFQSFNSGSIGVASASRAAILVPCAPAGQIPGGPYGLSVIVDLKQQGQSNEAEVRQSLIDLTLSAAQYAHKKVNCDLPFHHQL